MEIPKGHYIFGTVKVGERGQIIIPKEAREKFKSDVLQRYAADVFAKIAGDEKDEDK